MYTYRGRIVCFGQDGRIIDRLVRFYVFETEDGFSVQADDVEALSRNMDVAAQLFVRGLAANMAACERPSYEALGHVRQLDRQGHEVPPGYLALAGPVEEAEPLLDNEELVGPWPLS